MKEIEELILEYGSSCCLMGAFEIIGLTGEKFDAITEEVKSYQKRLIELFAEEK